MAISTDMSHDTTMFILGFLPFTLLVNAHYTESLEFLSTSDQSVRTVFKFENIARFDLNADILDFKNFPPAIHELMATQGLQSIEMHLTRGIDLTAGSFVHSPGLQIDLVALYYDDLLFI